MANLINNPHSIRYVNGACGSGSQVYFLVGGSDGSDLTQQLQVYADVNGTQPLAQPLIANGFGDIVSAYLPNTTLYTLVVQNQGITQQVFTNQTSGGGFSQNLFRYDINTRDLLGKAFVGLQVFVCRQPCNVSSTPSPIQTVYLDSQGVNVLPQPLSVTDGRGYVGFYALPYTYSYIFVLNNKVVATLTDQSPE